ncbi:MAG: photosystem I reaction center subunit IV [Hahellaceae bacterium]|nr:photosystem I reaction center subunit IV [Hahellaceae bacterium]
MKPFARGVGAILLGVVLASPSWAGRAGDVLESEAVPSDMAALSLLLDVEKAGSRLVAVGVRGHIVYSDDDGKTWAQAKVPVQVLLTGLSFADAQNGWAVGHGAVILRTRDGGLTWEKVFDGNKANSDVIEAARRLVTELEEKVANASDAERGDLEYQLEEATFAAEDAEADSEAGATKPLLDVWFRNANEGYVVGAYGLYFGTKDGGESWQYLAPTLPNPDHFHLNAINALADGTMFIVGEAGQIFRSVDQGATWSKMESPYEGSLFGVNGTGIPGQVLAFGLRGNAFRSEDNGVSWVEVAKEITETLMSGTVGDAGRLVLVGNSGMLLVSSNGGQTFGAHPREDRMSLTGALFLSADRLLLVGEGGVSVIRGIAQLN